MFMFPKPPPIDYTLEDVSPTFLSDGVFLHNDIKPSHKCVAKQLRAIERRISDPVATPSKLDPRYLNASAEKERSWYAGSRDGFHIYDFLSRMNEQKCVWRKRGDEISVFPRAKQYEYRYIQRKRLENVPKENFVDVFLCRAGKEKDDATKTDSQPCHALRPPFWWKDKTPKKLQFSVGCINDYAYDRSEYIKDDRRRTERSMTTDRTLDQNDDETQDPKIIQERKDALNIMESQKKSCQQDSSCKCSPIKHGITRRTDIRWQPIYEMARFSGTNAERSEELRKLTKPYLHELHTWYGKNLPTKLLLPVRWKGKRPIPEWRFSHL